MPDSADGWGTPTPPRRLDDVRRCYICAKTFRALHPFYESLCPSCAEENLERRRQRADFAGRRALVTGARTGVGYQVALRLLRDGGEVVATTRFPVDAALRYSREPDFVNWQDRLRIHALDLTRLPRVEAFAAEVVAAAPVDLLVHHAACAGERSPAALYQMALSETAVTLPAATAALVAEGAHASEPEAPDGEPLAAPGPLGLSARALVAAHAVASLAPYLLLGGVVKRVGAASRDRFVVFAQRADGRRPSSGGWPAAAAHVAMARGALLALAATVSEGLARQRVFVNVVDVGWIADDVPLPRPTRLAAAGTAPPLDDLDGAARALDPVVRALATHKPPWGRLWRDYREAPL